MTLKVVRDGAVLSASRPGRKRVDVCARRCAQLRPQPVRNMIDSPWLGPAVKLPATKVLVPLDHPFAERLGSSQAMRVGVRNDLSPFLPSIVLRGWSAPPRPKRRETGYAEEVTGASLRLLRLASGDRENPLEKRGTCRAQGGRGYVSGSLRAVRTDIDLNEVASAEGSQKTDLMWARRWRYRFAVGDRNASSRSYAATGIFTFRLYGLLRGLLVGFSSAPTSRLVGLPQRRRNTRRQSFIQAEPVLYRILSTRCFIPRSRRRNGLASAYFFWPKRAPQPGLGVERGQTSGSLFSRMVRLRLGFSAS